MICCEQQKNVCFLTETYFNSFICETLYETEFDKFKFAKDTHKCKIFLLFLETKFQTQE